MSIFVSSPDRLPYRLDCLVFTVVCYSLLGLSLVEEQRGYGLILFQITLEVFLLALICYIGLSWLKKPARFVQSLSALVGVNFVISAVSIPLAKWLAANAGSENLDSSILTITIIMVFWNLAVMSQILKRSFEISTGMSAIIAFNYFIVYQISAAWLY